MMWLGIVLFWGIMCIVTTITFFMKPKDEQKEEGMTWAEDWYKNIFFYGAYELADEIAKRSKTFKTDPNPCWYPIFIFWWAFSIKYFVPWALFSLMMWNFKADLDFDEFGRSYGSYHPAWQVIGFIYPLIGLIVFIVPIFVVTTPEECYKDTKITFDEEEH